MRPAPTPLLLILLAALAFAMRLPLAGESLWVDELHTAWTVADGLGEVAPRALLGNQSPLYFYGVWAATRIAGLSELSLRMPSLLAGAALAPLAFLLVRRWTNSTAAALLAGLIAVTDRDFLFYGAEARAYALVQAAALLRLAVFLQLLSSPTWRMRAAYVAMAGIMFHLHYTTAMLGAGEAIAVAIWARRQSPSAYRLRSFLIDSLLIGLVCLPAAPHVWAVFQRRENWEAFVASPSLAQFLSERFARRAAPLAAAVLPAACVFGIVLAGRRRINGERDCESGPRPEVRRRVLVILVWMMAPVLLALAATATDAARLFLYRYLIASATAVPVLAGLLCGLAPTRRQRALAIAATAAALLAVLAPEYAGQLLRDGRLIAGRNEDWRSAVGFIKAHDDRAPVIVYSGLIEAKTYADSPSPRKHNYSLLPVLSLYQIEGNRPLMPAASLPPTAEQADAVAAHGGAWLVLRAEPEIAARAIRIWRRRLESENGEVSVTEQAFGNVTVAWFVPMSRRLPRSR